jgi:hypothetical protein
MRERVRLLHAARIWEVSIAHARIGYIVIRAIRFAVRVLGSDVRPQSVREVAINCVRRITLSGKCAYQANRICAYNIARKYGLTHVARSTCPEAPELRSSEARLHAFGETRRRLPAVRHIGRHASKSGINDIRHQAWSTAYNHLAAINRAEMLILIDQ